MNLMDALIAGKLGGGSGGGGGAGMERFLVTFTFTEGVGFSADKTLAQITAARHAGKYVEGVFNDQYCPLVRLTNEMALFQRLVTAGTVVDLEWISVVANGCMADILPLEMAETTETVADTAATILPEEKHIYNCGELVSLTIDSPPATGKYSIKFVSGATPTATIIPPVPAMRWQTDDNEPPQGFPAANTRYEINVDDTYVVLGEWPVPEVSA